MLLVRITSLKQFMNQLLATDSFDNFLLQEATIKTATLFTIDGRIHPEFFPVEERESLPYEFQPWSEIKGLCFDLIKGKNTPLSFQFILYLKPEVTARLLEQSGISSASYVKAFALNIRFDGTGATLTTGTSYHTFVADKEADHVWDKTLLGFLDGRQIAYELLT